jgi:hypothetical protein
VNVADHLIAIEERTHRHILTETSVVRQISLYIYYMYCLPLKIAIYGLLSGRSIRVSGVRSLYNK